MPLSNATYGKSEQPEPAAKPEPAPMAKAAEAAPEPEPSPNAPGFPSGNGPAAPQLHPELHGQ